MEQSGSTLLLKSIAEYLNEETELYSMMHGALKRLVDGTNFSTGWIFFIDEDGKHQLVSDYQLPPALTMNDCHFMTHGPCWCVSRYHQKKLTKASNIITCSRIVNANRKHQDETDHITHHATVPLRSGDEQFGLLNVATPYTKVYSEEDLALLESVAFQIGSAIKRIFLTEQERETALQQERNRLARDLHDSVNQMLFSLKVTAHAAGSVTEDAQAADAFKLIESTSQHAVNEMRALIWQLKPIGLENGIVDGIKQYANVLNLDISIKVIGLLNLESALETTVFRIAQEALNNVNKHSDVNKAEIILKQDNDVFYMEIHDKGQGFSIDAAKILPTHGIRNIETRAINSGGSVKFESTPGEGTSIYFKYPKGS